MPVTWNEWYCKARTKKPYIDQEKEVIELIRANCGFINNVLDVGCGDGRFSKYFSKWQYWGLDRNYNEFDLLKEEEWQSVDSDFDICFTSLVLMLFPEKEAKYIFDKMIEKGKYIFLYEENECELEEQYSDEKWSHAYLDWKADRLIEFGTSKFNSRWKWYLYRGNKK